MTYSDPTAGSPSTTDRTGKQEEKQKFRMGIILFHLNKTKRGRSVSQEWLILSKLHFYHNVSALFISC